MKFQGQKLIGLPQLLRLVVKISPSALLQVRMHGYGAAFMFRDSALIFFLLHKFVGRVDFFFFLFICETPDFGAHGRSSAARAGVAHHQVICCLCWCSTSSSEPTLPFVIAAQLPSPMNSIARVSCAPPALDLRTPCPARSRNCKTGNSKPYQLQSSTSGHTRRRKITQLRAAVAEPAETASSSSASSSSSSSSSSSGDGDERSGKGGKGVRVKGSAQLARWARARRVRSGRRGERKVETDDSEAEKEAPAGAGDLDIDMDSDDDEDEMRAKAVYMISDGTGWTADHAVQAALGQFEHCLVDQRCSVDTHLFSQVNEVDRLMEIIRNAAQEGSIVFYTLADPIMAEAAKEACEMLHVPHINILGPITDALQLHLGVSPSGIPRGAPGSKSTLTKQYFKRIEAVEFTIRQDDGALPKNIIQADIVLTGVSRTSKTPLSTYMAQKGYKVANVPLVLGIDPPKELFEVDQEKVFGLTINPNYLKSIRLARSRTLGMEANSRSSYSDMDHIRKELEYSRQLFLQNPRWPVIEVTGKAIEETAAVILRIFHERRSKYHMPRISRRY